ncbi:DUF5060 domain-containing protein [Yoonia sp.]|uniref:DUF5060 domain-containing protein n=1 Tax=Yoonia sp. TaxID=2212373 RepID=UPI00391A9D4B
MSDKVIEKWGMFEVALSGPSEGNPYIDVALEASFRFKERVVRVPGFYDGEGTYKIRFMPDVEGDWTYETASATPALDGKTGSFVATAPGKNNRGPVKVRNKFHFAYADGTSYMPFGTTCYAWTHQPLDLQEQTLQTLAEAPFNKIRMGVFPKDYPYNTNAPLHDVFMPDDDGKWNFDEPNFAAFRHFETQIGRLADMGIEADIIIFHPYDRWDHANMPAEQDYRYVAYLTARIAAYRNVWWSLANEYDFMIDSKPMHQWDRYFQIIEENDPYWHLASIHNGDVNANYDHRKPWVTHTCIQNWDVKRTAEWRETYGKPVVNDEPEYEGNILQCWGNITPQELVHRYWITMMRGGYIGHGETYQHPDEILWWAKGGVLHGEAPARIAFLRNLLEEDVKDGLTPRGHSGEWPWSRVSGAADGDVSYIYLGEHQPSIWSTGLPKDDAAYDVDVIDTWNMTVTPAKVVTAPEQHTIRHGDIIRGGKPDAAFGVELPTQPYLAIRVRRRT